MKISEVIKKRHSCRTYNGLRLDQQTIERLQGDARQLPVLQPGITAPIIRLVDGDGIEGKLGTYGSITGARQFLVMASGTTDADKVEAGFEFEALILKITAADIATCWIGGTFRRDRFSEAFDRAMLDEAGGDYEKVKEKIAGRSISIVSPIGHPTPKKRFAERVLRKVAKADKRKPFADLFESVSPDTPLGRVLENVRLAPSSTNSQPWRATITEEYLKPDNKKVTIVKFRCAKSGQFAPFDMGIAYCHFLLSSPDENLRWEIVPGCDPMAMEFRSVNG